MGSDMPATSGNMTYSAHTMSDGDSDVRIRHMYLTNGDDSLDDDHGLVTPRGMDDSEYHAYNTDRSVAIKVYATVGDEDASTTKDTNVDSKIVTPAVVQSTTLRGNVVKGIYLNPSAPTKNLSKPAPVTNTLAMPESNPATKLNTKSRANRRVSIGILPIGLTLPPHQPSTTKQAITSTTDVFSPVSTPHEADATTVADAAPNDATTNDATTTATTEASPAVDNVEPSKATQADSTTSAPESTVASPEPTPVPASTKASPPPLPPKAAKNPALTGKNKTPAMGLSKFRKLISQKRIRFQDGKFDLDLSYITPQIIAMGLPAQGFSSLFRNPLSSVASMLSQYHGESFMLLNLTEDSYSHGPFKDQVLDIGWEDHHAPPIHALAKAVVAAALWISLKPGNVVAVHCKAGKGRTGTVIAALLVYAGIFDDPDEAFAYFSYRRAHLFHKGGVTIPSQRRSVHELCSVLRGAFPIPRPMILEKLSFFGVPAKDQKKSVEAYVKVLYENKAIANPSKNSVIFSRKSEKNEAPTVGDADENKTEGDEDESECDNTQVVELSSASGFPPGLPYVGEIVLNTPLLGDYLLKVKSKRPKIMKQENICRININTAMILPIIDATDAAARAVETANLVDPINSTEIKQDEKADDLAQKQEPTKDLHGDAGGDDSEEEEVFSPAYVVASPVEIPTPATQPSASSTTKTSHCVVLYRRDLDGAHKRKGFPEDFFIQIHLKEPNWTTIEEKLNPCDTIECGSVPVRPISFWEKPSIISMPSMFDPVWIALKEYNDFVAGVVSSEGPEAVAKSNTVATSNRKLTMTYLTAVRRFAYLKFKEEKPLDEKNNSFNGDADIKHEPDTLWRELMSVRLRNAYSNVAQASGLLPYENDDADFMVDNIVTAAKNSRRKYRYMA